MPVNSAPTAAASVALLTHISRKSKLIPLPSLAESRAEAPQLRAFSACRWSCQRQGLEKDINPEEFYEDRCCQDIFQNFLATITSRVNTVTGTTYRYCSPKRHIM